MNWCYTKRFMCEYANGAGFCTLTACVKSDAEVAKVVAVTEGTGLLINSCKTYDNIDQPEHYASQDIEPIDYMRSTLTNEEFIGYCLGNVIKYVSRWQKKNGLEDLRKGRKYLDWAIEAIEKGEDKKNG